MIKWRICVEIKNYKEAFYFQIFATKPSNRRQFKIAGLKWPIHSRPQKDADIFRHQIVIKSQQLIPTIFEKFLLKIIRPRIEVTHNVKN